MQGQFPKVGMLRQSKIYMAVATLVTAAAFPSIAEADDEKMKVAASQANSQNVGDRSKLKALEAQLNEKNEQYLQATSWLHDAKLLEGVASISDEQQRDEKLAYIAEKISQQLEITKHGEGEEGPTHIHRASVVDLNKVKEHLTNIAESESDKKGEKIAEFLAFLSDGDRVNEVTEKVNTIKQEYQQISVQLAEAREALEAAGETVDKPVSRYELRVLPSAGDNAEIPKWEGENLGGLFANGVTQDALIDEKTTLEITHRSLDASDPITGAAGGKRDVGTLHISEIADHTLSVENGQLNIHQAIQGDGELKVFVGESGTLTFKEGGKGILADALGDKARRVKMTAQQEGLIEFDAGTSAGRAELNAYAGGRLMFKEGANAGKSYINVLASVSRKEADDARQKDPNSTLEPSEAGEITFDGASAGNALIENGGKLAFKGASLESMTLTNHATGVVAIEGKEVTNPAPDGAEDNTGEGIQRSAPQSSITQTLGGDAKVINGGALEAKNMALQRMALFNAGKAEISASEGNQATVNNLKGGTLKFTDTQLQGLTLSNAGAVEMIGNTTADEASINLIAGSLDVSSVGHVKPVGDASAPGDGTAKAITIGSLSGKGDVIVGATALTIGSLNRDSAFGGRIMKTVPEQESDDDLVKALRESAALAAQSIPSTVTKVGTGNLTLLGDQSQVNVMNVQGGKLTAAHEKALGSGSVTIANGGALAIATPSVTGVKSINNAGEIDLGTNKLSVERYQSNEGAKISSRYEKVDGQATGGTIHVAKDSDFSNTEIRVAVADDIELSDVVNRFEVVQADENVNVQNGKLRVGSITGGKRSDPKVDPGRETKITDTNIVNFLAADGGYTANEQAVLASVEGVTTGDLVSGKIGGKVLAAMALQTEGTAEQRRSARMLSGQSLVNNAVAAQAATTSFQRGMQTRMIAGGSMFDDKTANGARADGKGITGWASFTGGTARQRGEGMSFDVKGLDGAIGVDKRVGQNTLVGGSLGFGNQESKAKGLPGESKVNSVSVGLYGSHLTGTSWFVNGAVSYTNHSVKTDRTVVARNFASRVTGKTSGRTFGMFGEVGKRFGVSGVNIDPSVGVRVASTRLNAFNEMNRDGQGNDGLKVGAQSQTSTRGVLGLRLWSDVAGAAGGKLAPSLRLSYERELGNTQSSLTNAIYGAPRSFTVKGPKLGKDIFTADLGLDLQLKKQLEMRVGGNVSVRKGESALGGGLSAKYRF